jgi:hypothetical protein
MSSSHHVYIISIESLSGARRQWCRLVNGNARELHQTASSFLHCSTVAIWLPCLQAEKPTCQAIEKLFYAS